MLGEAIKLAQKINVVHTPYQGEMLAVTAAVGGHITGVLVNLFSTAPFIKSGRLRGLAVTSVQRDPLAPDVPTAREAGVPEVEAINWNGLVAPAASPATAIQRWNTEVNRVLTMPEVSDLMKQQGMVSAPGTVEQFGALLKSDGARYSRIAREANVRLD
jgi:tripartite-type tricarboxylate transporter receptor subunit TctC